MKAPPAAFAACLRLRFLLLFDKDSNEMAVGGMLPRAASDRRPAPCYMKRAAASPLLGAASPSPFTPMHDERALRAAARTACTHDDDDALKLHAHHHTAPAPQPRS